MLVNRRKAASGLAGNVPAMVKHTGGARLGWVQATWGLAKLTGSEEALTLSVPLLVSYAFRPEEVISLQVGKLAISIKHARTDCPRDLSFLCFKPAEVIKSLEEAGFRTASPLTEQPIPRGMAFRPAALLLWLVLWLSPLLLLHFVPNLPREGPLNLTGVWLTFLLAAGGLGVPAVQRVLLKPGRHPGEVAPFLRLIAFITGFLGALLPVVMMLRS